MTEHTNGLSRRAFIGGAVALGAASIVAPSSAFAATAAEKQAEADAVRNQLVGLQADLEAAADSYKQALDAQEVAQAAMEAEQVKIDEANGKIADLQDKLGTRARSMYRTGSSSIVDLLLGATSFEAFATNWDLLNLMNNNDADLVQQTKDLRAEVQKQEAVYAEQQRVATDKANEAKRIEDEAASTVSAMQATYDSLSAEAAALLEEERAAQQAAEAAQAQAVVEASAQQAANNNGNSGNNNSDGNQPDNSYTPPSNNGPTYNPVTGNAIVDRAYGCIGLPYEWGGVGPNAFDCSGLVSYAITGSFSRYGTTNTFMGFSRVSDPQPGDICTSWSHCGIYIGGGQMIHAPTFGQPVSVGPVQGDMIIVRP